MSHPFLRDAHSCSYCQNVNGVTFDRQGPGKRARLLWVQCRKCTEKLRKPKSHYSCWACANAIGFVRNGDGQRYIAVCARDHWKRLRRERRERKEAEVRPKGGGA